MLPVAAGFPTKSSPPRHICARPCSNAPRRWPSRHCERKTRLAERTASWHVAYGISVGRGGDKFNNDDDDDDDE